MDCLIELLLLLPSPHSASEFVLHKLKEMGKISQDDISIILKEFENLDVDKSRNLSSSDLMQTRSSQSER